MSATNKEIARDLLMTAMEQKAIFPDGTSPSDRAKSLGEAYGELLAALKRADGKVA